MMGTGQRQIWNRGTLFPCMGTIAFAIVCLSFGSCSSSRNMPQLNGSQAAMLDSIPLLNGAKQIEGLAGKFKQHQCSIEEDSLLQTEVLKLRWWKSDTPPNSIAIPWPEGTSRNLQAVQSVGGISLFVKKTGESQANPVLVFELTDSKGVSSSIPLLARHIPVYPIDTTWQEVRIPFSDFTRGKSQTDWSDISSLNLKMEHFGEILLRDFVVVPHSTRKKVERKARKRPLNPAPNGRFILFEENVEHAWGLGDFGENRRFTINKKRGRDKSLGLDLEWDLLPIPFNTGPDPVPHHIIGFSWNGWQAVLPPESLDKAFLVFKLRNIGVNQGPNAALPIQIGIQDQQGHTSTVALTQDLISGEAFGKWRECRVPFSAFLWSSESSPDGLSSIGSIFFQFSEKGQVYIDDLFVKF